VRSHPTRHVTFPPTEFTHTLSACIAVILHQTRHDGSNNRAFCLAIKDLGHVPLKRKGHTPSEGHKVRRQARREDSLPHGPSRGAARRRQGTPQPERSYASICRAFNRSKSGRALWYRPSIKIKLMIVHPENQSTINTILRDFDLSPRYGPCVGMTRMERYRRAEKMGLKPPAEVLRILETVEGQRDWNTDLFSQKSEVTAP
jgi:DNA polymerase delta, subunit 4